MEFLAIVAQEARAYPALIPLALISIGLTLWACERRRWLWAAATSVIGFSACLLYVGTPARAMVRLEGQGLPSVVQQTEKSGTSVTGDPDSRLVKKNRGATHALLTPDRFSSSIRMHPRFPADFPLPRSFRLESNSGGAKSGNLTIRFRFTGEAANAVCDLRLQGRSQGWDVEILAPHRMVFRKDGRMVEAWFSYPAHSVVLDIPDNR